MKLKPHPLSELKPIGTEPEYLALKAQIKRHGQQVRITRYQGKILDGRRRYRACIELGVEPKFEDYKGSDPLGFVKTMASSAALDATMRAVMGANLIDAYAGRWGGKRGAEQERTEPLLNGKSSEIVAREMGTSPRSIEMAVAIKKQSPALFRDLMTGEIRTLKAAYTRMNHKRKARQVADLRAAANVTMKDCDLREGDNLQLLTEIPADSIQAVFADPPYNNGWNYRNDPAGDRMKDADYLAITRLWMFECARLLHPGGSLFVLIDDRYSDHFGLLLRETSLSRQPTIVCWETFANYNSAETGLSQNARYLHWFSKGKPQINAIEARVESDRNRIGDARAVDHGRLPPNVWPLTRVTSQSKERCPWLGIKGNAPQLPVALPERCILLTSQPGDTVLDPFNGNGITGIAALASDRSYVGLDRDAIGLKQSRKWIAHEVARRKAEAK